MAATSRSVWISDEEGSVRGYFHVAAAAAIALAAASGPSLSADEPRTKPATTADQQATAGSEGATTTVLDDHNVQPILGKDVRSISGDGMGRIVDVIVDKSARPRAAVIDFGGFLGVGSRKIVVDWSALRFSSSEGNDQISVDLTRDQVKAAPEFKTGKPVTVVGALGPSGPEM
jgi:hypothetical protein